MSGQAWRNFFIYVVVVYGIVALCVILWRGY